MAVISDYNSLATTVQQFLNRNDPDTVDMIGHFICVAEQNIYRDLRVPTMEAKTTMQVGFNELDDNIYNTVAVPGNYLETRVVSLPDYNIVVRPVAYAELVRKKNPIGGLPSIYTRDANSLHFNQVPDDTMVDVTFHYYRAFANLSPDNIADVEDPRPFLRVTSDAWLYGALVEAAAYLGDSRAKQWLGRYQGSVQSLQKSADELELSGTPLQVSISSDDFYYGPSDSRSGQSYV